MSLCSVETMFSHYLSTESIIARCALSQSNGLTYVRFSDNMFDQNPKTGFIEMRWTLD